MKQAILLAENNSTRLQDTADEFNTVKNHNIVTASSTEDAIEKFQQTFFDAVVLSADMSSAEKNKLIRLFGFQQNDVQFFHLEENKPLLQQLHEITQTIAAAAKPSYQITDDALQNAKYNINIEMPE